MSVVNLDFDYNSVPEEKLRPIADAAFSTYKGLRHGYLAAKAISEAGIPGVFVECGVAGGAQIGMMSRALSDLGASREFHLFDSFEGIPMAGPRDHDQPGIGAMPHDTSAPIADRLVSSGISAASVEKVQENLKKWECSQAYNFHRGWFQQTLPHLVDFPEIALLRIDVDLYESMETCLRYLYNKVAPGGIVVVDDFGLRGCRAAIDDFLEKIELNPDIYMERMGDGYTIATWRVS